MGCECSPPIPCVLRIRASRHRFSGQLWHNDYGWYANRFIRREILKKVSRM